MRWFRFAFFVLVVAVIQASLLDWISVTPLHIKPNLLLILLVFFVTQSTNTDAIIVSFVIGFSADMSSFGMYEMGSFTVSFGLFGTALTYLRNLIVIQKLSHQAVVIFIMSFLAIALAHFLSMIKGDTVNTRLWTFLFGTSLYSAAIGPYVGSALLTAATWIGIKKYRF